MTDDSGHKPALVRYGDACFRYRGLLLPVAIGLLLIPSPQMFENATVTGLVGLTLGLIGEAIRIATIGLVYIIRGGRDHRVYAEDLVTEGLYAHCRNPMYLGNAFLLAGLAIASNSVVFAIAGVAVAVAVHVGIIAAEEYFLEHRFGPQYQAYRARVPRLIPRLAGIEHTLGNSRFNWARVLDKEFSGPVDWLAAITLIALAALWRSDELSGDGPLVTLLIAVFGLRLGLWRLSRAARRRAALAVPPAA